MAQGLLDRYRFPAETVADVGRLVRNHMYAADPGLEAKALRRFARRVGPGSIERQFALRAADIIGSGLPRRGDNNERFEARVREVLAERPPLSVRDLAIGGDDVIAVLVEGGLLPRGSRGSPAVGRVLGRLLEAVLDAPEANTREQLLPRARMLAVAEQESSTGNVAETEDEPE
jgi:tRNA nucleotidyltransferase (CCA-adding enzyme)